MKPVPLVLETEGTHKAALINVFDDSSLVHGSKIALSFCLNSGYSDKKKV